MNRFCLRPQAWAPWILPLLAAMAMVRCKSDSPTKETDATGPSILAVQPASLEIGGILSLSVIGDGTHFADSIQLRKGDASISGRKESGTDTTLVAAFSIPLGASTGQWDLVVGEADGKTVVKPKAVSLVPATVWIDSITPNTVDLPGGADFAIFAHNTGFSELPVAGWLKSGGDSVPASGFRMRDMGGVIGRFTLPVKPTATEWSLYLRLRDRLIALENAVKYQPIETALGIEPDSAQRLSVVNVKLTGTGTRFDADHNEVWLEHDGDTLAAQSIQVYGASRLDARFAIPEGAAVGTWQLKVSDSWHTLSSPFRITDIGVPRVTNLSPASGAAGSSLEVTLSGERVAFNQGTATSVYFWLKKGDDSIPGGYGNFRYMSEDTAAKIPFQIPADAAIGTWDVYGQFTVPVGGHNPVTGEAHVPASIVIPLAPLVGGFRIDPDSGN